MIRLTKHITIICLFFISFISLAQNELKGYKIEGDTIVFRFDKRDYLEATHEKTGQKLEFADFDIDKVAVSGKFNHWSREGWKMNPIDENVFELKKSVEDLDAYKQEFKFIINGNLWAEPTSDFVNIVPAKTKEGIPYHTYNLNILKAFPKKDGNANFFLKGYPDATKVVITGSFSKWNPDVFEMKRTQHGWELALELPPKKHEYRFVVDGKWMEDPANPHRVRNRYKEYNSVIDIKKKVEFFLPNSLNAEKVILSGSFNNWDESALAMKKDTQGWKITLAISGGKHHYKFIVDGLWLTDPNNSVKEYDGNGNINSVIMIK